MRNVEVSVVVPVYYNAESVKLLHERLAVVMQRLKIAWEVIYVDDGSGDESLTILKALARKDPHVRVLRLSRNFGSFNAIMAGISVARGRAVMDLTADLQDDPTLVARMVKAWSKGAKVVLAVRRNRHDGWVSSTLSAWYYQLFRRFALSTMPSGGFDIFLIDRQVVALILSMEEQHSSLVGQILWSGFAPVQIAYTRKARPYGTSRWTLAKKLKYFIDSFVAFSYFPVRLMSLLGLLTSALSFVYGLVIVINKLFHHIPMVGWSSLALLILFLSGIQMLMLGVIGEYVWRSFEQTKRRPRFVIEREY